MIYSSYFIPSQSESLVICVFRIFRVICVCRIFRIFRVICVFRIFRVIRLIRVIRIFRVICVCRIPESGSTTMASSKRVADKTSEKESPVKAKAARLCMYIFLYFLFLHQCLSLCFFDFYLFYFVTSIKITRKISTRNN